MSGSNDDILSGGCGCLIIFLIAAIAAVIHFQIDIDQLFNSIGNIIKVILGLGGVGLALWLISLVLPEEQKNKYDDGYKTKRDEKPKKVYKPDRIYYADESPRSVTRSQESRVSRLEVPGGYVPFEMTKTVTKTKDTVKRETKIKTYVDSREVKAILKGKDVDVLTDGK